MLEHHSEATKEYAKFEQLERDVPRGLRPGNPYVKREYPAMLYQARQMPNGKYAVAMQAPAYSQLHRDMNEWARDCMFAESFTASCQRVVASREEHMRAREDGWRDDPAEAMLAREALDKAVSDAAAERNWTDRNMGEKAKAEAEAFEKQKSAAGIMGHTPEVPDAKKRKSIVAAE